MRSLVGIISVLIVLVTIGFGVYMVVFDQVSDGEDLVINNPQEKAKGGVVKELVVKKVETNVPGEIENEQVSKKEVVLKKEMSKKNSVVDSKEKEVIKDPVAKQKVTKVDSATSQSESALVGAGMSFSDNRQFKLSFLNKKLKDLPLKCDVEYIGSRAYDTSSTSLLRKKGEDFLLIPFDKKYKKFNITLKNVGYAVGVKIPIGKKGNITIELFEGGDIAGEVFGPKGQPLSKVKVTLSTEVSTGFGPMINRATPHEAVTDEKGQFKIRTLVPNRYELSLQHEKYIAKNEKIEVTDKNISTVKITMKDGFCLEGILYDHNKNRVIDAKIHLQEKLKNMWGATLGDSKLSINTNEKGEFSFIGLKSGKYSLSAKVDGVGHLDGKEVVLKEESLKNYELALSESFQIKGKVVNAKGEPVEGVYISSSKLESVASDKSGEFVLDHLDKVGYQLSVSGGSYRLKKGRQLNVQAGVDDLIIEVRGLIKISGKVYLPNGGLAKDYELTVKYSLYRFSMPVPNVKKEIDGFSFSFSPENWGNVKNNKASFVAKSKGYSEGESKPFTFEGDDLQNIEIHLKENIFCEFLISSIDEKKIEGVEVLISPVSNRMMGHGVSFETYKVNDDGKVIVGSLIATDYDILIKSDGYATLYKKLTIKKGLNSEETVLTSGSTIEGVVFDDNQAPVAKQKLQLKRSDLMIITFFPYINFDTYSDKDGRYKFENIPAGEYRIKRVDAKKEFNPMDMFNITDGELIKIKKDDHYQKDLGVSKSVNVDIAGIIKNSEGKGLVGMIFLMDTKKTGGMPMKMVMIKDEGKFEAKGIRPGNYHLMFQSQDAKNNISEKWEIEVKEDAENIFNLTVNSERASARVISVDGDLLNGSAYFLKAGSIDENSSMISLFKGALSTTQFKEGDLKFKIPEEENVDVYFSFRSNDVSFIYFKNVSVKDVLLKDWTVKAPKSRKLKVSVKDVDGNELQGLLVTLMDGSSIPIFYENNMQVNTWDAAERVLGGIPPGASKASFYKNGYAVAQIELDDDVTSDLAIVLEVGFDINSKINGDGEYVAYLLDENKKEVRRPKSQAEIVQEFMGGVNPALVKANAKNFKHYLPGKYYIKLINTKTKVEKTSDVIELVDSNIEIVLEAP